LDTPGDAARLPARAACGCRPTWRTSPIVGAGRSARACRRRCMHAPRPAVSGQALPRQVVVDEQGRLAGVLSRGDMLRAVINNFNIYMRSTDA